PKKYTQHRKIECFIAGLILPPDSKTFVCFVVPTANWRRQLSFHHLVLTLLRHIPRRSLVFFRELLNIILQLVPIILRKLSILLALLSRFVAVAPHVANTDFGFFRKLLDSRHQLLSRVRR